MKALFAVSALALSAVAVAAPPPPPPSSSLRGGGWNNKSNHSGRALQQVAQQLCFEEVSAAPNREYRTVACDFAFFENCGGPYTCAGDEGSAAQGGEGGCQGKFTLLQLENSPSCPWEYQCC